MQVGYSGTPLVAKLGIKARAKVAFVGAPDHYLDLLGELPPGRRILRRPGTEMDFVYRLRDRR